MRTATQDHPHALTPRQAEERNRLEAELRAEQQAERTASERAARAQFAREREQREAEQAKHAVELAAWQSEVDQRRAEVGHAQAAVDQLTAPIVCRTKKAALQSAISEAEKYGAERVLAVAARRLQEVEERRP
jgi:hypothetical protein